MIGNDDDELMYQNQVAAEFQIPNGTLRHWRSDNRGPPSFRMGESGRVMYRRSDVERWVADVEKKTRRGDDIATDTAC